MTKIERASYCHFGKVEGHDSNNCRQCELLEKFFFRLRALALGSCNLYKGDTLQRTEKDVSADISKAISSVELG